jgi:hypothetical protein
MDPTAEWYTEHGRVWLRMEMSQNEFTALRAALLTRPTSMHLGQVVARGEREKTDGGDILERFGTPDEEMKLGEAQ